MTRFSHLFRRYSYRGLCLLRFLPCCEILPSMAGPTQNSKFTLLIPNSDPLGEVVILQSLEVEKIGWYMEEFVQ